MKFIVQLIGASRRKMFAVAFAGLVSSAILAMLISFLNRLIREPSPTTREYATFVALCAAGIVARYASQQAAHRLASDSVLHMRIQLTQQLLRTPLRQLEETGTTAILTTLTEDLGTIAALLPGVSTMVGDLAVVLFCLVYLATLSLQLLALWLVCLLVGVGTFVALTRTARRSLFGAREHYEAMVRHFRAVGDGAKELKLHKRRRDEFVAGSVEPAVRTVHREGLTVFGINSAAMSMVYAMLLLSIVVVVARGHQVEGLAAYVVPSFAIVAMWLMTPLQSALNVLPLMDRANVGLRRLEKLGFMLNTTTAEFASEAATLPPVQRTIERIEMVGITHTYRREYDADRFTLGPVDLVIRGGRIVFLVGSNGSGKSTLAKVLTGLYAPEDGYVTLNGQRVLQVNRDWYRQHFAAVFSDYYLFDTLVDVDNALRARAAQRYLASLQLDHKVRIEGATLSTTQLSAGQRKRLALLVAYMEDRAVYVFDEWAAEQDPVFRHVFYTEVLPELKARGKAVFVISHDEKYFYIADDLLHLDAGRLERAPRHDDHEAARVS